MNKLLYIFICVILVVEVSAQSITDALRYSQNSLQGTARATSMGNAFGSLGGDFTSASINPAGIGVYRSSEFSFTSSFAEKNVAADYLGTSSKESVNLFNIPSVSYVATLNTSASNKSSLVSTNFGIGFNRINNFKLNRYVEGHNASSSMLDSFAEEANEIGNTNKFSEFYELAAWETYMLNYDENTGLFSHKIANGGYGQSQTKSFNQRGYVNEYNFSLGLNFNHKVYAGFSLGVHDVYYKEETELVEYDSQNKFNNFDDYSFYEYLKTTGVGVNGKLGVIYKPVNTLRLGLALHTPTFYNLNDLYYTNMTSRTTNGNGIMNDFFYEPQYDGEYEYSLQTPWKAVISAACVIGNIGLISIDCDFIDYSTSKLRYKGGNEMKDVNSTIDQYLKPVVNIHMGGEIRMTDFFSLRAGVEYLPGPFKSTVNDIVQMNGETKTYTYSGGVGWRASSFYLDLAYKYYTCKHYLNIYPSSSTNASVPARFSDSFDNITLTLGFRL